MLKLGRSFSTFKLDFWNNITNNLIVNCSVVKMIISVRITGVALFFTLLSSLLQEKRSRELNTFECVLYAIYCFYFVPNLHACGLLPSSVFCKSLVLATIPNVTFHRKVNANVRCETFIVTRKDCNPFIFFVLFCVCVWMQLEYSLRLAYR